MADVYAPPKAACDTVLVEGMSYASRTRRLCALLADLLIYVVALYFIEFFMSATQVLVLRFVPVQGLLFPLYRFYMQGKYGHTFGQRLLKIRVVRLDGSAIGFGGSARRSLLRTLIYIPWIVAKMIALSEVSAVQFSSLSVKEMRALVLSLMPAWADPVALLTSAIVLAELGLFLFTARRQALSDLIAATIVVNFEKISSQENLK